MLGYDEIRKEIEGELVLVEDEPISDASEGEQDDENDWGNNETIHDEQEQEYVEDQERYTSTSPVGVKRKNRLCAYCFELTIETDMILVPKSAERRKEWIEVFGEQFELFMKTRKTPYLCKKHLDDETRQPKAEAIYHDRKFEIKPQQHYEKGSVRTIWSTCCYCSAKNTRNKMKSVPTNPEKRELWVQRLGEQFGQNIKSFVSGAICNSHFPESLVPANGRVSNFALPIPFDDGLNEENNTFPITTNMGCKCAYCGKHDFIVKMVPVPEGPTRDSWCFILGERFAMNLTKLEHLYICSSHFEDEKPTKDSIPCVDDSLEFEETDNTQKKTRSRRLTCTYCCAWVKIEHTIFIKMTPSRLETWSDILGEEFEFNVFRMETTRMCKTHFRREDFVDKKYRRIIDEAMPIPIRVSQKKKHSDIPNTKQCLYCNKFQKYRKMIRVLYNTKEWHRYTELIGPDFDKSFWEEEHNLPAVCRIHLNEEGLPLKFLNTQVLERIAHEASVEKKRIKSEEPDQELYESSLPSCSKEPETMDEDNLCGLYKYGWDNPEAMELHHKMARKASLVYEKTGCHRNKKDRCIYCLFPIRERSSHLHFVEEERHLWEAFGEVFGLQYLVRLEHEDSEIAEVKMLCMRHIDTVMMPIPDTMCFYATDELLDHTYANFS